MKMLATTLRTEAQAVGLNRETIGYLSNLHELAVSFNTYSAWERFYNAANTLQCCTPIESPAFDFYAKLKDVLLKGGAA